jgi:excisionase family DNA binding protein
VPEYLTIQETAALLRLGERVTYEKLRSGVIPGAAKVGGKWRVNRQKLIEWMDAGGELADQNTENEGE